MLTNTSLKLDEAIKARRLQRLAGLPAARGRRLGRGQPGQFGAVAIEQLEPAFRAGSA
jgi:hypothetical protein